MSRRLGKEDRQVNRQGHIVKKEPEVRVGEEMLDVLTPASNEIVETDDFMALGQKPVTKMRAKETCSTRNHGQRPGSFVGLRI
jgi:hypothetical protein